MRIVLLALTLLATPALAQEPIATCARQTIATGFEAWGRGPAAGALLLDRSASLKLTPAESVAFAMPPARPVVPGTFGGAFPLRVAKAGEYSVALSSGAWIDVVGQGKQVASTGHRKGDACSGIAKIVTFALAPGEYVVQLSEAKADGVMAMVVAGDGVKASALR